jgi:hypothetical protein
VKSMMRLVRFLFKYGMPFTLVLVPAMAIYGVLVPWPAAESILAKNPGQTPVLVGGSYRATYTSSSSHVSVSRTYVLFPGIFTDPKLVSFAQENDNSVTTSESQFALFIQLGWLIVCAIGTWWFWLRRVPPNNSFKPNPLRGSA